MQQHGVIGVAVLVLGSSLYPLHVPDCFIVADAALLLQHYHRWATPVVQAKPAGAVSGPAGCQQQLALTVATLSQNAVATAPCASFHTP
jgi:hypothetical protein